MFVVELEKCLDRPASLDTDVGDDEGYGRKDSMVGVL